MHEQYHYNNLCFGCQLWNDIIHIRCWITVIVSCDVGLKRCRFVTDIINIQWRFDMVIVCNQFVTMSIRSWYHTNGIIHIRWWFVTMLFINCYYCTLRWFFLYQVSLRAPWLVTRDTRLTLQHLGVKESRKKLTWALYIMMLVYNQHIYYNLQQLWTKHESYIVKF